MYVIYISTHIRRSVQFMSETWNHWFVGADNTGDITTWDNLLAFRESVKKDLEEVHLVGIVCSG
jgi:hypothetical protein